MLLYACAHVSMQFPGLFVQGLPRASSSSCLPTTGPSSTIR